MTNLCVYLWCGGEPALLRTLSWHALVFLHTVAGKGAKSPAQRTRRLPLHSLARCGPVLCTEYLLHPFFKFSLQSANHTDISHPAFHHVPHRPTTCTHDWALTLFPPFCWLCGRGSQNSLTGAGEGACKSLLWAQTIPMGVRRTLFPPPFGGLLAALGKFHTLGLSRSPPLDWPWLTSPSSLPATRGYLHQLRSFIPWSAAACCTRARVPCPAPFPLISPACGTAQRLSTLLPPHLQRFCLCCHPVYIATSLSWRFRSLLAFFTPFILHLGCRPVAVVPLSRYCKNQSRSLCRLLLLHSNHHL